MKPVRFHSWNISPNEAIAIQNNLRRKIIFSPVDEDIRFVGGTAVALDAEKSIIHAALTILKYPSLEIVEQKGVSQELTFDYISGLLTFREGAPLMSLFRKTDQDIDLIVFHSHGQSHPRRFGLASHLGVLLDVPSIGVSNKMLAGSHDHLSQQKYSEKPILLNGETIGMALRSKESKKPIYVSTGHRSDLTSAVKLTKQLVRKYRLPEPIRLAQLAANQQKEGGVIDLVTESGQESLF
jgi:Deoxyinosine 3''endonuclease (endonuclease V)